MSPLPDSHRGWIVLSIAVAVGSGTALLAPLPDRQPLILGITLFCIALWIGNPVPPWFTGLVGIGLIGTAFSPELALGGFSEPVLWLIVFGLVMGEAIHRSGLAAAVERRILRWITADIAGNPAGDGAARRQDDRTGIDSANPLRVYRRLLVVLCFGGLAFALMVPSSMVRVLILAPILIEIGRVFESREARLGLLFGPLFSTFYGAVGILTAFLPNIVIAGIVGSVAGVSTSWSGWFLALFPVMGLGRVLVIIGVIYLLFRPDPESAMTGVPDVDATESAEVRRTAAFLLVGVAFWATDFVHGLHPVFGALAVTVLFLTPRVGTVTFDAVEDVDVSIVFFVGAVFAIAAGLSETGFTDVAAEFLLSQISPDASTPVVLLTVFGATLALILLVEGLAAASVLTPVLASFAAETGLPVEMIVQMEAIALGHFFFPYQSIVLVAMLGYDPVEPRQLVRVASALSIATIVVLLPLQVLYFLVVPV